MDFGDWMGAMQDIYAKFQFNPQLRNKGTQPKFPPRGGYLIVVRLPEYVAAEATMLSEKIAKEVPAIIYRPGDIHTTISDYMPKNDFVVDGNILDTLQQSVEEAKPYIEHGQIDYASLLMNTNTAIIPGTPQTIFFYNALAIQSAAKKIDVELRLPWGSHMTVSRFTETVPASALDGVFALMKEHKPLGYTPMRSIDVGYYELVDNQFKVTTQPIIQF